MMQHEFTTPLSTALMFLDIIINKITDDSVIQIIILIKSALNLLLSLVWDLMDLKMIKEN